MKSVEEFRAIPEAVFGGLIAWDLPVAGKSIIDVREALVKSGLDPEMMPNRTNRDAIAKAKELFSDKHEKSLLFRKIRDDDVVAFGIVHEKKDKANDRLHYNQQTTIVMDKSTGHLRGEGPHFEEFREIFDWVRTHAMPVDIQQIMREIVRLVRGIAYRHYGGTYFYAASDANVQLTLSGENFINNLGINPAHVSNIPLSGGKLQKEEIFYAASNDIKVQIEKIRKAAENVQKRASSLSNHEGLLRDAQELMEYYISLTEMEEREEQREEEIKAMRNLISNTEEFISNKMAEIEGISSRKTA